MFYRWIISVLFLACVARPVGAQLPVDGPRAASLAYSTVADATDPGTFPNPATVAGTSETSATLWATQLYGMSDLTLASASIIIPTRYFNSGFSLRTYGSEVYRESEYRLAFARSVHPGSTRSLMVGLAVAINQLSIEQYGSSLALTFGAGGIVPLTSSVTLGFSATNLSNAGYRGGRETLPRTTSLGVAWQPVRTLTFTLSGYAESRYPVSLRSGVEVLPVSPLALRLGVCSNPSRFSAGFGVRTTHLRGDVAFLYHDPLGWTPMVGVTLLL